MKTTIESFSWNSVDRISDRYGSFNLPDGVEIPPDLIRKRCRVTVTVIEVKRCTHIGDLCHGFGHTMPKQGESHVLAVGELLWSPHELNSVAIKPIDDRKHFWIDPMLLYRLCHQKVEIVIEEDDTTPDIEFPFWCFVGSKQAEPQWVKDVKAAKEKANDIFDEIIIGF